MSKPSIPDDQSSEALERNAILEAATKEFAEFGYFGARVDRIAERSEINKRFLYQHFGTKENLYLDVLSYVYGDLRRYSQLLDYAGLDPMGAMLRVVDFLWNYYLARPEVVRIFMDENLRSAQLLKKAIETKSIDFPLDWGLHEIVKQGVEQGVFRPELDPIQVYLTVTAITAHYIAHQHTLSAIFEVDLMAEDMLERRRKEVGLLIQRYLSR